jgi:hypothetical protein
MKRERARASEKAFLLGVILLVFAGACFPAATRAHGRSLGRARVIGIEHHVTRDRIRVVVRFDAAVQYVGGSAQAPFRIFFDLEGTRPAARLASRAPVDDSIVRGIRVAQNRPGVTRMVLDLTRPAPYTATFLPNPPRLVVEVMRAGAGVEPRNVNALPASGLATAPPPPETLVPEQMSPLPPQVTYRNGLLTIVAANSTLSDILHEVAVRTGATVEAPASLIGQRVAARIGPAPPREVMADLLSGLDYIVVGASNDPGAIRNIILSPNSGLIVGTANMSAAQAQASTAPAEQSAAPAAPEPTPQPVAQESKPSGEGGQAAPPVKTPEELLEELHKLQEQQAKDPGP